MFKMVEYKPEHLEKIDPKECHLGEVPSLILRKAVTILNGETPIAIFSAHRVISGVDHIFALLSKSVRSKPIEFHKTCLKVQEFYDKTSGARRFQIDVRDGYAEGLKWAESLGFVREGVMKRFAPDGSDCWLLGRENPCFQPS